MRSPQRRLLDWFDLTGTVGSLVAGACCLGLAPVIAVLSAVGLGFLINDAVLLPMLVVFLGVSVAGLWRGSVRHRNRGPLLVGLAASLALVAFLFVWFQQWLAYLSMAVLVASTVWNIVARRRCETTSCTPS